ncbi:glutamate receptor 2.2-like [Mangifera indica]|uniref:glutamate receptor 2.2-like n=1 Tax=Mangifera indica TaxID=29780 RepID=UPI001CF96173|nr:glutamate receptor 2.2-like [Mangifera indica]
MRLRPCNLVPFSLFLCLLAIDTAMSQNSTVPVNVGVILNRDGEFGKMSLSCINMALSDFYATKSHYKTRLILNTRHSKGNVIGAAAAALDLIKNVEVQAIIGPENSMETNFVIELGNKSQVPIISFSATSTSLTSLRSPYFFQATANDSSQVGAITSIIQVFGWREAVPIYVDNEFGEGMIPYLTDALEAINTRVPNRSVISPVASDDQIAEELYKLMTMQTRVFIVHMLPSLGSRLFAQAKEIGMMNKGYVWIITDGLTDLLSSLQPSVIESMQGVLGVKRYVPKTKALESFRIRWKRKFQQENPGLVDAQLSIFGLLAYDATMALAMAVEKAGTTSFGFDNTHVLANATDLEALRVSKNGPKLLESLSATRFRGLTGDYTFVDGHLQSLAFQIVNVNGDGARGIGFWTPESGLTKKLNSTSANSTSKSQLGAIIWPGDSISVPKGWEIPTNGEKLRIVVPVKNGYSDFVKVTTDPSTKTATVTGYCIDVFNAVMQALPYAISYEFIPFALPNGSSAGSYDDMIYQVKLGKFDAVVGDTTIVANRSQYVDFALPYTESGVSMIVPVKDDNKKSPWVFLKPLSWDLWITTACFFLFIGFVIWVLEHRINEDFRGPLEHQVGTSFWFSFSTMVFAQRERVLSNMARFVVIVWCFVVLILTQSYTASLTSLLTVQRLQPTVSDVAELIKREENVGYQQGSFVLGILKQLGFKDKNLLVYDSVEECDALFQNGTANGGIAAAFDEVPYIKLFLGKYCSKYSMVDPTFKTAGFGFAFPLGSPLVADVSRAILNVTEGPKMNEIEDAWFKKNNCPDPSSLVSSRLGLNSFWGLFLIAGIASILTLIISMAIFLHKHREVLKESNPRSSLWTRVRTLLGIFVSRDLTSHTFKEKTGIQAHHSLGAATSTTPSPCNRYPASPSSFSQHTDQNFAFDEEQGTPSTEHGNANPNPSDQARQDIVPAEKHPSPDQERA